MHFKPLYLVNSFSVEREREKERERGREREREREGGREGERKKVCVFCKHAFTCSQM